MTVMHVTTKHSLNSSLIVSSFFIEEAVRANEPIGRCSLAAMRASSSLVSSSILRRWQRFSCLHSCTYKKAVVILIMQGMQVVLAPYPSGL